MLRLWKNNALATWPSRRRAALIMLALLALSLAVRLPGAIWQPSNKIYYDDELFLADSVHYTILGQTPTTLTWPSGTFLLPLSLIYVARMLINPEILKAAIHRQPDTFLDKLSEQLALYSINPWNDIAIGRVFGALLASLAPLAIYWLIHKQSQALALGSSLLLATSPFFSQQSWSLQSDAAAVTFWSITLTLFLWRDPSHNRKTLFAGAVLLGTAMASKFLYAAFLPLAIAVLLFSLHKPYLPTPERLKNASLFLLFAALTLLFFAPFLWTSPVALAKSALSSIVIKSGSGGNSWHTLFFSFIPAFVGWPALIVVAAGAALSFKTLGTRRSLLLAITFAIFAAPLGRAADIATRHALPLLPILAIWFGIGIKALTEYLRPKIGNGYYAIPVILLLAGIAAWNITSSTNKLLYLHAQTNVQECASWIEENLKPGSALAVPRRTDFYWVPNSTAIRRAIEQSQDDSILSKRLTPLFGQAGLSRGPVPQNPPPALRPIFGEDAQMRVTAMKQIMWLESKGWNARPTFDLYPYVQGQEPPREHDISFEEVVAMFNAGKIDALMSYDPVTLKVNATLAYASTSLLGVPCFVYTRR